MTIETDQIRVIDLWPEWTKCHRCGKDTLHKWGLPVDCDTGNIVPTWFEGEPGLTCGGVPACRECYERHQEWSEELARPFDAPLC